MKKTKIQRDYHNQMKSLNNASIYKPKKTKFTQTRFFYYGIRILLIFVIMSLVSQFDNLIYSFLGSL